MAGLAMTTATMDGYSHDHVSMMPTTIRTPLADAALFDIVKGLLPKLKGEGTALGQKRPQIPLPSSVVNRPKLASQYQRRTGSRQSSKGTNGTSSRKALDSSIGKSRCGCLPRTHLINV
jgi:hypothetical protein